MGMKNRKFWPHHVLKSGFLMLVVLAVIVTLAYYFRLPTFSPDHPEIVPNADDGMYIPQPEWYFLLLWQPFWYLTGGLKRWIPVYTFYIPVLLFLTLLLVPFLLGRKKSVNRSLIRSLLINIPAVAIILLIASLTIKRGYIFKAYGCVACHNKYMGVRQALPPMDIAKFYIEDRARMIKSAKYTAGKRSGEGATLDIGGVESYKDSNWQLRHGYEPTFTW
ncbi:MAG: hypothetical protein HZB32_07310 [Nitrospirae bacterium]|nr:hypothetical protein [Nitrospirota bacterium]